MKYSEDDKWARRKYVLKVVRGRFSGDQWRFNSIEDLDEFIVRTRQEGCGGLVKPGTMAIFRHGKKIGER